MDRNMFEDKKFRETTIECIQEEGNGWVITDKEGWSFFVDGQQGPMPKSGGTVRFYGNGIGTTVRGLVIDGHAYYYRTEEEESERHKKWCEDGKNRKRREFIEKQAELDAAYNDLPEVFKRRLDRFRSGNPDFRWEFESYEMSCCVDAVNIATKLKTVEAINKWRELSFKDQQKQVSIFEGHSGNSFSCAVGLAKYFLTDPELVAVSHGALTPLVGCKDYGCTHPTAAD
jgi:hypothetical protein